MFQLASFSNLIILQSLVGCCHVDPRSDRVRLHSTPIILRPASAVVAPRTFLQRPAPRPGALVFGAPRPGRPGAPANPGLNGAGQRPRVHMLLDTQKGAVDHEMPRPLRRKFTPMNPRAPAQSHCDTVTEL